ncbi:MAG: hypothetical protein H6Q74_1995 [Firmicutes bacterium]|nr:hypothetical protein [Bacillota bacterium]
MDVKVKLLMFAVDLLAPLIVGYLCRFQNKLKDKFFNKMILNNILVVYPALSFLSFWVLPLNMELIWLPLLGLAMGLIPGAVGYFIAEHKYASDLERGSYVMSAILSNVGTLGGLCVFLLYGETGYAYQQLVVLFQYILMFIFCYPLAQYYYERSRGLPGGQRISVKAIIFSRNQLAVLGILLGAVLNLVGIQRPTVFGLFFNPLVHLGAWTALIPVGYSIDIAKLGDYFKSVKDIVFIKFFVTPLCVYGLASIVISDHIMLNSILVLACMPTAVNAVITARIYNLNLHIPVAAFILTTLVFLLVIYPALFMFLAYK